MAWLSTDSNSSNAVWCKWASVNMLTSHTDCHFVLVYRGPFCWRYRQRYWETSWLTMWRGHLSDDYVLKSCVVSMKCGSFARIWTGLNPVECCSWHRLCRVSLTWSKLIRHRCWSVCVTIVRDYFCGWETRVLTAKLIKLPMWHMAHSKGDWMGQTWIECDYGAWRVQFKYPAYSLV